MTTVPEIGLELRTVLFAHAHPDDETLATGALIAWLAQHDVTCHLVTATRGERGEVVPGSSTATEGSAELEAVREQELAAAAEALGISSLAFLGNPPALAVGEEPRRYRDSGMQWVRPGVAGPANTDDAESFTAADPQQVTDDLAAMIAAVGADLVVSYQADGGYGHPDHVRMHEVSVAAAAAAGVRFAEIVPEREDGEQEEDGLVWYDLAHEIPTVVEALQCHATQLTVDGDDVIHVGGQREPIRTALGLRLR